jgi:DUF438 domain-containing protein
MKIEINLDETYGWSDDSIAKVIMEEVHDEIRRAVKRHLKNKDHELKKAIDAYARKKAAQLQDEMMGLNGL